MNCLENDGVGCLLDDMGGWFGRFLSDFGSPASIFLFFILLGAFLIISLYAVGKVLS